MFLTQDKAVYTNPWIRIPLGSNATLSSVKPWDLCIVRAHASLIGNCFQIFKWDVFFVVDSGFAMRNTEIHSFELSMVYKYASLLDWQCPMCGS
jgi:hypothetical protein